MTHFVSHYGLWFVFGVVFLENAGLPFIPGETAMVAAAALAADGHGSIEWIIVLAIVAAILGSFVGYAIGEWRGRELLSLWPWFERISAAGVHRSEEFFRKHGSKAVFLGRFVPIVRATLGWMAGVSHMPLGKFLAWNVIGAVSWACGIGLAAYYAGSAIIDTIQRDAAIGIGILVALVLAAIGLHVWRRKRSAQAER